MLLHELPSDITARHPARWAEENLELTIQPGVFHTGAMTFAPNRYQHPFMLGPDGPVPYPNLEMLVASIRSETPLRDAFGVADSVQQVLDSLPAYVTESEDHTFILTMMHVPKGEHFRWHKQGRYIGEHEPTAEEFADEPGFPDGVWKFSLEYVLPE